MPAGLSGTEAIIAAGWARRLPGLPLGRDVNFFDAGATSLDLAALQAALGDALGREVPVVLLFGNPTLAALAAALDRNAPPASASAAAAPALAARQALAARRAGLRAAPTEDPT